MGVLKVVVSSKRVTSEMAEWCSKKWSVGMSCHLFRAALMRWAHVVILVQIKI